MRSLLLVVLTALLATPTAHAAQSISALQEPVESEGAVGAVAEFSVTEEEAAEDYFIVFRVEPQRRFSVKLIDGRGEDVWGTNATNGIRPFYPNMTEGTYKLVLNGPGDVQVTRHILRAMTEEPYPERVEGTLEAPAQAWLFQSAEAWRLRVEGNVTAEVLDVGGTRKQMANASDIRLREVQPYVITLRGDEGAAYVMTTERDDGATTDDGAPETRSDTPAPGLAWLALAGVAAALGGRRARRV